MPNQTSIRISSGELHGRKIPLKSGLCHPMGERERLALFNSLSALDFSNFSILDLFAGSGALGLESLSRGAKEVIFIESNPELAQNLKTNLKNLNLSNRGKVIPKKVQSALEELPTPKFDLIFADPPYDNLQPAFLEKIPALLKTNGIFILSHPKGTSFEIQGLTLKTTRTYANCSLTQYTTD